MKSFWERLGDSMRIESVAQAANKIQIQHNQAVQESRESEQKAKTDHKIENTRKAVFGRKSYQAFRGQNIIAEIKGFFHLTPHIIVAPALFPSATTESMQEELVKISQIADYLNTTH